MDSLLPLKGKIVKTKHHKMKQMLMMIKSVRLLVKILNLKVFSSRHHLLYPNLQLLLTKKLNNLALKIQT